MSDNYLLIVSPSSFWSIIKISTFFQEILLPENSHLLERSFTVRFRCLLDNTSGFLVSHSATTAGHLLTLANVQRLDIRGKIKPLYGQNRKSEDPPLALFCICTPFGPPSLLEMPQKEAIFKSKHKLDLGIVSFDQRGKEVFGYNDVEFSSRGIYDLVHHDDLVYVAQAHSECKYILQQFRILLSTQNVFVKCVIFHTLLVIYSLKTFHNCGMNQTRLVLLMKPHWDCYGNSQPRTCNRKKTYQHTLVILLAILVLYSYERCKHSIRSQYWSSDSCTAPLISM